MTRSFWQSLPPRPLFFLLAAAFFTFGAWGFVDDMRTFGARSHPQLATMVVLSGVIAALYAWSAMRARRLLPLVVLFHVLAFPSESLAPSGEPALPQLPAQVQALRERFTLDSAGIAVFIVLGYAFFVRLVAYEGVAHLRAQKEIHLAQEIHTRLVPAFHERRGAFEVSGLCRPSGAVGGDLVDVVATPDGWTALVADVSGHGVAAGLLMGMVKSAARMRLASAASAGELLDDLNRVLFPLKAANMFVTCACLRHAGGGTLEYALAGHLPVLHWRAADGTMAELAGPHLPLGIVADHEYAPSTVSFASGDLFAVLTDGLTEVADAQGRELGLEGVKRLVAGNADRPLDALMEAVMTGTRAHGTPHDDQTLLLVRCE